MDIDTEADKKGGEKYGNGREHEDTKKMGTDIKMDIRMKRTCR